jgi:hypothetical protein
MSDPRPNLKRRNWLVLVILATLAALLYVTILVKSMRYGLPPTP